MGNATDDAGAQYDYFGDIDAALVRLEVDSTTPKDGRTRSESSLLVASRIGTPIRSKKKLAEVDSLHLVE